MPDPVPSRRWLPLLLAWVAMALPIRGQSRAPEFEIKARVLRSLGSYVAWPNQTQSSQRPFVLGVLGDNPFESNLEEAVKGKLIHNRKITVTYLRNLNPTAIESCDILFICESESDRLQEVLRLCRGRPILTVGDTSGFALRGVMLNMVVAEDRVSFEVNTKSIRGAGLEVSSSLLASPRTRILESP